MTRLSCAAIALLIVSASVPVVAQRTTRPPLANADIDAIAQLVMLEDTRQFDSGVLSQLLKSSHPEVRRRAIISVGRIVKPEGRALLVPLRTDPDPDMVATVAFSTGQLKDPDAVTWLMSLLADPLTPAETAKEAACALGKIGTPEARAALETFLTGAPQTTSSMAIGEALLAMGRFTGNADIAPIVKWATSRDPEVRWRAAWALFRPRNPAAVQYLLILADDSSAEVRFWAVRGLVPAPVTAANIDLAKTSARLRAALKDNDRRVRTEALRALAQYDDDASFNEVLAALDSKDTWLSVSAAENMGRFRTRAAVVVPKLVAASAAGRPTAIRITALAALRMLAPDAAVTAAAALVRDSSTTARNAAVQALQQLGDPGRAKLEELASDPATRDLVPARGAGGGGGGGRGARPEPPKRTIEEYRQIVERWIVPAYNGKPAPRAIWQTPRGEVEIELYPGDVPIGTEYFVRVVESGDIVGTEFSRVVPNFVDQQATIRGAIVLRDEVNRHGLTRANLSWASADSTPAVPATHWATLRSRTTKATSRPSAASSVAWTRSIGSSLATGLSARG